jgi:hypothetical protein
MKTVVAFVFICVSPFVFAQKTAPALERLVTLTIYNEPIHAVLDKIAAQTGVKFSYNPSTVKVDKKVSFVASKKPVRSILKLLFDESIHTKQNGHYIILTYKTIASGAKTAPVKEININGYIYSNEGSAIEAASIYNADNLLATVSNEYGYYKLTVPANQLPLTLKVAKENYTDTSIRIVPTKTNCDIVLNAPPRKKTEPIITETPATIAFDTVFHGDSLPLTKADTVAKKSKLTFLQDLVLSENLKASIRNIKDTAFRKSQVTFIPYVSTNGLLSVHTVNDYSFNILVGYAQGVNKFELGGLMNIDRGNVKFGQVAGLFNAVGGNVAGAQVAGIGNMTKGRSDGFAGAGIFNLGTHTHGIQLAGIANVNLSYPDTFKNSSFSDFLQDTVKGIQIAGITNINAGYTEGVRLAGTLNIGHSNKGVQVANIMNANWGKSTGINITWILNYMNDTLTGYNISGITNVNRRYVDGVQIAGIINVTDGDVKGMQITSLVNIAKHVTGTQIALLNFSDSSHGLPIGLISFVKSGYHKLEFFGDDMMFTQLAFRTGIPVFHNIFSIGIDLSNNNDGLWNFGYGLGSNITLNKKWNFTTDLITQVVMLKGNIEEAPILGNLFLGIERNFSPRFAIAIGPVYHAMMMFGSENTYKDISSQIIPYSFTETTYANGNTLNMWIGGKISFRFF